MSTRCPMLPSMACKHSECVCVIESICHWALKHIVTFKCLSSLARAFLAVSCDRGSSARVASPWTCSSTFFNPCYPRRRHPARHSLGLGCPAACRGCHHMRSSNPPVVLGRVRSVCSTSITFALSDCFENLSTWQLDLGVRTCCG